jgi:hypothetical protein
MISVTDPPNPPQIMRLSFEKNDTFACLEFMQRISLLLLFIIFLAIGVSAQRSSEIGLSVGGSYYVGELNPATPFVNTKPALGIFYRRNLNSRLALQVHALRGSLAGDGKSAVYAQDSNLNFKTNVTEFAAQFEVNFFDFSIGSQRDKISPYIFGGVGVFLFKPTGVINGNRQNLRPLHTEGQGGASGLKEYSLTQLCFPFGLGVKYSLGPSLGLGMEWGMRKTTTDYIDDISTVFPSGPNAGLQRGNSKNNDWYSFAMISISYKLRLFEKANCLDQEKYRSPKKKSARN